MVLHKINYNVQRYGIFGCVKDENRRSFTLYANFKSKSDANRDIARKKSLILHLVNKTSMETTGPIQINLAETLRGKLGAKAKFVPSFAV